MPAYIDTLRIVTPATSGEVETQAIAKLGRESDGVVELIGLETQDVPAAQERKLSVRVQNVLKSHDGGQLIRGVLVEAGVDVDDQSVTISTEHDAIVPATVTIVSIHHE